LIYAAIAANTSLAMTARAMNVLASYWLNGQQVGQCAHLYLFDL
jgi:hypothetical protein